MLNASGYRYMLSQLMNLRTKLSIVLEGGYNLDVLQWGSEAIITAKFSIFFDIPAVWWPSSERVAGCYWPQATI